MATHQDLAPRPGANLAADFADADIPVLATPQRQGDVLIFPSTHPGRWPETGPFPLTRGVPVAGEEHPHVLYGDGEVYLAAVMSPQRRRWWVRGPRNTLAWLRVPKGGAAFLMHSGDHAALGIGPGVYEIRRQLEYRGGLSAWEPAED